LILP